jgi:acyl-CoA thioesterase YciA
MTDQSTHLPAREPVLRVVPMPADVNQHGDIFGGWIMAQVDIAGGVVAARQARGRVATVAVNSFTLGRTSVTVTVEVFAQRNPDDLVTVKVTEASLTYVAVGADRRPRVVSPE